ncbi:MAG TPA: type VI secretion system baseplate subunit TssG [Polyangiaceae bacterium]|jgi:type VI secretion system protein ImpH
MAGPLRKSDAALKELLESSGKRFGFFTAVHLLHRLQPNASPVGELGPSQNEPVRFRHDPQLIFHAGDVSEISFSDHGRGRATLVSTFLGLYGAASPLATHFAEEVIRAELNDEPSLRAFYDLLHHRLLSLFYRAWKKYRPQVSFRTDGQDAFTRRALTFVGMDFAGAIPRHGLPPFVQLALAPLLSLRTRPERTLRIVLGRLFPGISIGIVPFIGRQARIERDEQVSLGLHNTTLGVDVTIGTRVHDRASRFRVCVGPVEHELYDRIMPGGQHYPVLRTIIEHFTRGVLECELEVTLADDAAVEFRLCHPRSSVLGVNTQLGIGMKRAPRRMRALLSADIAEAKAYPVLETDAATA